MKISRIASLMLVLLVMGYSSYADPIEEGKVIFTSRCAGCHNVNQKLTGPALAGIDQRRSIEWIIQFVHSSQTMVKNGDKDAVALFEQFNKVPMPDHPDLTDDNIKQVVEYIKLEAKPVDANAAPFAKPKQKPSGMVPLSLKDYWFFIAYAILVAALVMSLVFAVRVRSMKNNTIG